MTAGRGPSTDVPMDTAEGSAPMTVLFESNQHSNANEGDQHQMRRKGLKRPRTPLQSKSSIGQLARLVSRDFSSDACDQVMTEGRNSIGSDSIEDGIRARTLMPPPHESSGADGGVHKNIFIRTTTPSPLREEQETNDDLCLQTVKTCEYDCMQADGPCSNKPQASVENVRNFHSIAPELTNEGAGRSTEIPAMKDADHPRAALQFKLSSPNEGDSQPGNESDLSWDTNSIKDPLLRSHLNSMRLEKSLIPLRPLISRLMSHPTYNRKGIFNKPVDPDALGLLDYRSIISRPMDLGTVKNKLHALTYQSTDEAVEDIRLVFKNAMAYNPPANPVHIAAKALLEVFENGYAAIVAAASTAVQPKAAKAATAEVYPSVLPLSNGTKQASLQPPNITSQNNLQPHTPMSSAACPPKSLATVPVHKNVAHKHSCQTCQGKTCPMCLQSCLHLEPAVLICAGSHCAGAKIRRGAQYHSSPDGSRCWCHRCYTSLSAILPAEDDDRRGVETTRYKRSLIKRKNDEEVVEDWIECISCHMALHKVCAMFNEDKSDPSKFVCLYCVEKSDDAIENESNNEISDFPSQVSFMSGIESPVEISTTTSKLKLSDTDAQSLPTDPLSSFLERKVRERMVSEGCPPKAEQTVVVRTVSNCSKDFRVPEVVRRHFRMETRSTSGKSEAESRSSPGLTKRSCGFVPPPEVVPYQSKAIALFQRIDGVDICIFCMYVQEYDKTTTPEQTESDFVGQNKRVYVAYLDSVEHFRPRKCRTAVYQEMLVAYLAASRARGYESAHIWACPPSRGNSFVFWVHPSCQRTPTRDRLERWYHQALSRAVTVGAITDIKSLYEVVYEGSCSNQDKAKPCKSGATTCPPLLDGDYWMEEAVLLHQVHLTRYLKSKPSLKNQSSSDQNNDSNAAPCITQSKCPTLQVASLLEHRIFTNTLSLPFQRPVNAAALNLRDYHDIVTQPMDLGTVHIRCLLGDYENLEEMVGDVELVVRNATRYNPPGHVVHIMALDLQKLFFVELNQLAAWWTDVGVKDTLETEVEQRFQADIAAKVKECSWKVYKELSMRLGVTVDVPCTSDQKLDTGCHELVCTNEEVKTNVKDTMSVDGLNETMHTSSGIQQEVSLQNNGGGSDPIPSSTCEVVKGTMPSRTREYFATRQNPSLTGSFSGHKPFSSCSSQSNSPPAKRPREVCTALNVDFKEDVTANHEPKKRNLGTPASSIANLPSKLQYDEVPLVMSDLRSGGSEAVAKRMVGSDTWMLERKHAHSSCPPLPHASHGSKKKKNGKKKAANESKKEESSASVHTAKGERKESWLGDEVGEVLRRMRRDFFVCDLRPREKQIEDSGICCAMGDFETYMGGSLFEGEEGIPFDDASQTQESIILPRIADARHALLEFSQRSHLQFDTLRRAKYSTAMLLHQLHSQGDETPGLIPSCSSCGGDISGVRWHKTRRAIDDRNYKKTPRSAVARTKVYPSKEWEPQELCVVCYSRTTNQKDFIPLRVSFHRVNSS